METGTRPMEETVEDVVLRHSNRGMNILREYMEEDYCKKAVETSFTGKRKCVADYRILCCRTCGNRRACGNYGSGKSAG